MIGLGILSFSLDRKSMICKNSLRFKPSLSNVETGKRNETQLTNHRYCWMGAVGPSAPRLRTVPISL
jgi:hypothetical protein